ncbi:MAG: coenzyme F420-0:L-glutamate ligase [Candidatus Nezhaarchaeales archaeon]|nr:MAG: coenzyme F420-0:L-glutamate ligase [Candidatus Nezhaarchaeota archaeon WYZ-LMO8]TDA36846.1 MAG: coenzyme F420-0:L-glutamate ligase [Candidatus Nezhaarchaeota archaeon WYZ-LMO7]
MEVKIIPIRGIPVPVKPGDDIAKLICEAAERQGTPLLDGDILVVSQKIVSKACGHIFRLSEVKPSEEAVKISRILEKSPELVEIILRETNRIVRLKNKHIICETKHGFVCANAGVDVSNVDGGLSAVTLPLDPDKEASKIRETVKKMKGVDIAVIISDTHGRAFRRGQVNVAIGVAGMKPLRDRRGERDLFGYILKFKFIAIVDEIASAAELVMGQADEGVPAAIIRGLRYERDESASIKDLVMSPEEDLFR